MVALSGVGNSEWQSLMQLARLVTAATTFPAALTWYIRSGVGSYYQILWIVSGTFERLNTEFWDTGKVCVEWYRWVMTLMSEGCYCDEWCMKSHEPKVKLQNKWLLVMMSGGWWVMNHESCVMSHEWLVIQDPLTCTIFLCLPLKSNQHDGCMIQFERVITSLFAMMTNPRRRHWRRMGRRAIWSFIFFFIFLDKKISLLWKIFHIQNQLQTQKEILIHLDFLGQFCILPLLQQN